MGEAFRDPEHLEFSRVIAGLQVESGPLAEVGGVAAKIDGDVPDMAGEDANEFSLGFAKLVVEATENAVRGERLIVLNELLGRPAEAKVVVLKTSANQPRLSPKRRG